MECKYCAAHLEPDTVFCPYCGSEVTTNAKKLHEAEITNLKNETEKIKKETRTKNLDLIIGRMGKGVKIGFAIFVILLAVALVSGVCSNKLKANSQQKKLAKLETMYQEKDYAALREYYRKCNEYGSLFAKYDIVSRMQGDLENVQVDVTDKALDRLVESEYNDLNWTLYFATNILIQTGQSKEDGYRYNEEVAVAYFEESIRQILQERLLLSSDEIQEMISVAEKIKNFETNDLKPFSDMSKQRLKEKKR